MFNQAPNLMTTVRGSYRTVGVAQLLLLVLLASCTPSQPTAPSSGESTTQPVASTPSSTPSNSTSSNSTPSSTSNSDSIAKITEIQQTPVWVKLAKAKQEQAAQTNMSLKANDTIRTEGKALAEVTLTNGLGFRVGGDAVLTLQDNNQLNLQSGSMLTWVEPGKKVPAEIVTSAGIAGIRGTTVFVGIPEDPNGEVEFFSWEGTVAIRIPGQTEELILNSGEQLKMRRGEKDLKALRRRIRKFTRKEHLERSRQPGLIRNFSRPLPTLKKIETALFEKKTDR